MEFEALLGVNPWTALFTLANTVTLFFVMRKYLFGPVMQMIEDRQQEIDGMYTAAGNAKEEAVQMQSAYRQKLSAAQAESERLVAQAVARGQSREDAIIRQAKQEAAAILDKAAADIARERNKAMLSAKDEISVIAVAIAGKVVERELTAADRSALVDSFIGQLGDGL